MERVLHHVRALHRLEPANADHLAALRVALSVAVPSLLLLAAGRTDLIIYAVFGALTGMYGRSEPHQLRVLHQSQAALVLLGGVSVGVFLSVNHIHSWALVGIEAALAGWARSTRTACGSSPTARSSASWPWAPARRCPWRSLGTPHC